MEPTSRIPEDVVGHDPALLNYWASMSDKVRLRLLSSGISVSTLGELQLLERQLESILPDIPISQ